MNSVYAVAIHGGSGRIRDFDRYAPSLGYVLNEGDNMLRSGHIAVNVAINLVANLEDNQIFNAGRGSALTEDGRIEMDASVVDGKNLDCGAVAAVSEIKNPIRLAAKVLNHSDYVLLVGAGAMTFAREQNIEFEDPDYFITDRQLRNLKKILEKNRLKLPIRDYEAITDDKMGTVGAAVLDIYGNLAAATSTGGTMAKKYGRVGDTPIVGAGVYADNESVAVSSTGKGEDFLRTQPARAVAEYFETEELSADIAANAAIKRRLGRVRGRGGLVVVDKNGEVGSAHSSPALYHGDISSKTEMRLSQTSRQGQIEF
jgi:L-asparaginase / beta-aspartyl-peptidase